MAHNDTNSHFLTLLFNISPQDADEIERVQAKKAAAHRKSQDEARNELERIAIERMYEMKARDHALKQKHALEALLHTAMMTIREQALHEKVGEAREQAQKELRALASMALTSEVARRAAHADKQTLSRSILAE